MPKIAAVISRFPERELAIRRLCSQDSNFLSACEDFEEATIALRHWEGAGAGNLARANEYREIRGELEAEVLSKLDTDLLRVCRHED